MLSELLLYSTLAFASPAEAPVLPTAAPIELSHVVFDDDDKKGDDKGKKDDDRNKKWRDLLNKWKNKWKGGKEQNRPTPEPASLALLGLGLGAAGFGARRRDAV